MAWNSGFQLRVKEPGARERIFPLEEKLVQVERLGSQIPSLKLLLLDDRAVSRHHANFKWQMLDQTFLLVHKSKSNPTLINGDSFSSVLLVPNDVIQMGDTRMKIEKVKTETEPSPQAPVSQQNTQDSTSKTSSRLEKTVEISAQETKPETRIKNPKPKFTWKPPEDR